MRFPAWIVLVLALTRSAQAQSDVAASITTLKRRLCHWQLSRFQFTQIKFLALVLPILFASGVFAQFPDATVSTHEENVEHIDLVGWRVALESNTTSSIFLEFNDLTLVRPLLLPHGEDWAASVVFGGDGEIAFSLAIIFTGDPGAKRKACVDRILHYTQLRLAGVSPEGAVKLAVFQAQADSADIPEAVAKVIRRDMPQIPPSAFTPIRQGPLVALPEYTKGSTAYLLVDKYVAFVVVPFEEDHVFTTIIDGKEFSSSIGPKIHSIARTVQRRLKARRKPDQHPASTYWYELQTALRRVGIKWRTPIELNPSTVYE